MSAPARPETRESPWRPRQLRGDLCEVDACREPVSEYAAADVIAKVSAPLNGATHDSSARRLLLAHVRRSRLRPPDDP